MKTPLIALLALFLPSMALAGCPAGTETLINCTFKNGTKSVTTCMNGDMATYSYGPTGGTPELQMTRHIRDIDMQPWHGFGRWIFEAFTFQNGDYNYTLRYAIDKLSEDQAIEGDLWVGKGEKQLAELICDAGSVDTSGYALPLYDAKIANGQSWDREEMIWTATDNQ